MATMQPCGTYADQSVISVTSYGALCVEPAEVQGEFAFHLPTAGTWFKDNWYVIFIIALTVALSIVAISLQALRWCRRLKHRHLREERDKRVNNLVRLVSSSFRVVPASSVRAARNGEASGMSTTSSSTTSDDNCEDSFSKSPEMSVGKGHGEHTSESHGDHRHYHHRRSDD